MSAAAVAAPSAGPAVPKSTPVTIVTGFLGAGKTTLLNKILKQFVEDRHIAVIENEFGEVNLDSKMVSNKLRSKEDLVAVHNGCVCCSLRKDIVSALAELHRRSEQAGRRYDNIILETTGLADPAPVAFTFFANSWAKKRFHLDSIVTVVDAKHLERHLASGASVADLQALSAQNSGEMTPEQRAEAAINASNKAVGTGKHTGSVNEVFNQIAFADVVLLNKIDLVSDEAAVQVETAIREINGLAKVVHTRLNDDDCPNWLSTILDGRKFSLERALEVDQRFLEVATSSDDEAQAEDGGTPTSVSAAGPDSAPSGAPSATPKGIKPPAAAAAAAADEDDGFSPSTSSGRARKRSALEMEDPSKGMNDEEAMQEWVTKKPRKLLRTLHDLTSVRSVYVLLPGELDAYLFNMFMTDFLTERGVDIFRSKGTLSVHGHQRAFNFQGVHETFQLAPCRDAGFDVASNPHSEIVFIGKQLDKCAIKQGLLSCLWRPLPPNWSEYLDKKTCRTYYVNSETGAKSWTRPVHTTPEGIDADAQRAAAAVAVGEERTYVSETCVKQPQSVRPGEQKTA